jgi:L-2-hydroxycarboxylate dehydrogenase (NAD+)
MADYQRIPVQDLTRFARACLEWAGMSPEDAAIVAENLVRADLRGIETHGINRLSGYVRGLKAGRLNATAKLRNVHDSPAALLVDAGRGLGVAMSAHAMDLCMDRAAAAGACIVGVTNSSHNGAASLHAMRALDRDMIGLSLTGGGIRVTPAGGAEALLGTNPIAAAIPTAEEPPFVMDIATSVVAGGKLETAVLKGTPIPLGWALDPEGRPTTNAEAGNQGPLLPLGSDLLHSSHKGYALGLLVDLLCNVLVGLPGSPARRREGERGGMGHVFLAFRIDRFRLPDEFRREVDRNLRLLRTARLQEGVERIYTPGEIEHAREQEGRRLGVPIYHKVVEELRELAAETGVAWPEGLGGSTRRHGDTESD